MERSNATSIDRFRRRRRRAVQPTGVHTLLGRVLGAIDRRYGLMSSEEPVVIAEVVATSGDLAVADRLAFLWATERHVPVVVLEVDGWYVACTTERPIGAVELPMLRMAADAPRIMSLVTDRGITPALGPLCA